MNSALQSGSLPHRSPATGHGPLTPVFATLTSRPQITENPTTLSPFLATHTDSPSPNSFICHSYENNRGVYQLFPKWNAPAPPERNSLALPSTLPPCYNLSVSSSDSATHRELLASASDSGARLDRFIASQCPELSRTRVQELIVSGLVQINGHAAKKGSLHLHGGERITLEITERPPIRAEAESIPLDVLYEDDDVIAINKPAGMTVHAG